MTSSNPNGASDGAESTASRVGAVLASALDHLALASKYAEAADADPADFGVARLARMHTEIAHAHAEVSRAWTERVIAASLESVIAPAKHYPVMGETTHPAIRLTSDTRH
jgi:hypothetical protein